ncbi:hypothetical protein C8R48DRAFT_767457 [Suillus tomentosus]|nr:hypothetical protein C8R48DRAFT_767457 [Suillus tomentosus]
MSIPPLLAYKDVIEFTDDEHTSAHDVIKNASDPDNENEEIATEPCSTCDSSLDCVCSLRLPSPKMGNSPDDMITESFSVRDSSSDGHIQILDAQHPALELDIHKPPIYLLHHNIPQSSLLEIIVEMKDLAVLDDEKEGRPIFPCVLASQFQERPDIKVALRPNFGFGHMHPKSSSCEGEIKNNFEPQNVSSSSKSKVGFNDKPQ